MADSCVSIYVLRFIFVRALNAQPCVRIGSNDAYWKQWLIRLNAPGGTCKPHTRAIYNASIPRSDPHKLLIGPSAGIICFLLTTRRASLLDKYYCGKRRQNVGWKVPKARVTQVDKQRELPLNPAHEKEPRGMHRRELVERKESH